MAILGAENLEEGNLIQPGVSLGARSFNAAPKTVSYMCQNNPANEIVANFFETDPKSARLERGDKTKTVWLVTAPTGPVYEGQNVSFTTKGNDATASWMNEATGNTENLTCKVR